MDIKDYLLEEAAVKYLPMKSPADYLIWERQQELKHEYLDGEIVSMAGATIRHNLISSNLFTAIGSHLNNKPCRVMGSDLRVEVKSAQSYFYPDMTIICGELEISDAIADMITNPTVIIEILSSSTSEYDTTRKNLFYMQIPSLQEYIMIDSNEVKIIRLQKQENGAWKNAEISTNKKGALLISSIELSVPLQAVYRDSKLL